MSAPESPRRAHCEWGPQGLELLHGRCDALIVIDVLSFATAVEVALGRGAAVFPADPDPEAARRLAEQVRAELAGPRGAPGWSLSPRSLLEIPPGARLVLPSLNGASLCLLAASRGPKKPIFCAGLRNAAAVARAVPREAREIAVLPAGERWPDGSIRFALEDWLGAGAVLAQLAAEAQVELTPEARAAAEAFTVARAELHSRIEGSLSGQELCERGDAADVALAAEANVSAVVPELEGKSFVLGPRGLPGSVRRRFFQGPRLTTIPSKRSDRDLVLAEILAALPAKEEFPERELNDLLGAFHPDFCTLRRDLVDGGFLSRAAGVYRRRARPLMDGAPQ